MRALIDFFNGHVNYGDVVDLQVHLITEYKPCGPYCTPRIASGLWEAIAQAYTEERSGSLWNNIELSAWRHLDNGSIVRYTGR